MAPKVYIETTIPSYLTARLSRDLLMATHQQLTHVWWQDRRHEFELYISQLVINECQAGDAEMARKRIELLGGITALDVGTESLQLGRKLVTHGPLPPKAEIDAFLIAVAAANAMDYLLTWNMKHIQTPLCEKELRACVAMPDLSRL